MSSMRGIDTPVRQRRRRVFKEVANLAYNSTNLKDDMEALPYKIVPAAAEYMKQLGFSEGYELLYAIAFGYPDEMPAAKPREVSKVKFVD